MDLLKKENTIRRRWLVSFYIYSSFIFLNNGLNLLCDYCFGTINYNFQDSPVLWFTVLPVTLFLHYYYGYKKRGFLLLKLVTIVGGLKCILGIPTIISILNSSFVNFGLSNKIMNICYLFDISVIFISIYYLINCRKLYLLNYDIKHGNQKSEDVLASNIEEKK